MTFTRRKLFLTLAAGFPLARVTRLLRPQRQYTYPSKCQQQMGVDFFWPDGEQMAAWQLPFVAGLLHQRVMRAAAGRRIHWDHPRLPPEVPSAMILDRHCHTIHPLPCARYIMDWDGIRIGWNHRLDVMVEFEESRLPNTVVSDPISMANRYFHVPGLS